ncbi:hypothetical protein P3T23_000661 [Paraburkholderia sp. GAS448]
MKSGPVSHGSGDIGKTVLAAAQFKTSTKPACRACRYVVPGSR